MATDSGEVKLATGAKESISGDLVYMYPRMFNLQTRNPDINRLLCRRGFQSVHSGSIPNSGLWQVGKRSLPHLQGRNQHSLLVARA